MGSRRSVRQREGRLAAAQEELKNVQVVLEHGGVCRVGPFTVFGTGFDGRSVLVNPVFEVDAAHEFGVVAVVALVVLVVSWGGSR